MRKGRYLCVAVYGLVEPGGSCAYCDAAAGYQVSTGADPAPEFVCGRHAAGFLMTAARMVESIGAVSRATPPA